MKIVYQQGKHTRTVYTSLTYVAKAVALIYNMGYTVIAVKSQY